MAIINPDICALPDGTKLVLRSLEGGDAGTYIDFMKDALATSTYLNKLPQEYNLTTWKQRTILRHRMTLPTSFYLGAFAEKELVAVMMAKGDSRARHKHKMEIGIATALDWRGKGIGHLLLQYVIDWCLAGKIITKIELNVNAENHGAIKLYEGFGFQEEGRRRMAIRMDDGHYSDDLLMGLILEETPTL